MKKYPKCRRLTIHARVAVRVLALEEQRAIHARFLGEADIAGDLGPAEELLRSRPVGHLEGGLENRRGVRVLGRIS